MRHEPEVNWQRTALLVTLVLMLFALLVQSQALASKGRVLELRFGGSESTVPNPYPLGTSGNNRVAVDATLGQSSSGDIYVTDPNNLRVEKFAPSGNLILMFGENVNKTAVEKGGATEAERNVCTVASGDVCQPGTNGSGPGAFAGNLLAVAVDSSGGPSKGDVYVASTTKPPLETKEGEGAGEGVITKFNQSGEVISSWGVGGQMHGAGRPFGAFGGVTVDTSGDLWIYGTREAAESLGKTTVFRPYALVFELDETGSLLASWQPSRQPLLDNGGIAVDEHSQVYLQIFEGLGHEAVRYTSAGERIGALMFGEYLASDVGAHTIDAVENVEGSQGKEILSVESSCVALVFGTCTPVERINPERAHRFGALAVNYSIPSDTIYVAEENREIAAEPIATLPSVTSLPATAVSTSSATLQGKINPEGVLVTHCVFQWGEGTGAYEHEELCTSESELSGTVPVTVEAKIPIQAGRAYHFRLVAANAGDAAEPVEGADVLLGPPRVDSNSVAQVTSGSATLQAEINPRNLRTRYHFEYLSEASYEANGESFAGPEPAISVPVGGAELAPGQSGVPVSAHVVGLGLHTGYRYRVVAENVLGEGANASDGSTETLLTWNSGGFSLSDGRAWEMVSPPDKRGALVEPIGEDWIIQAAAGGGRLAYVTRAPSESNPAGYLIYQSSLATRTSEGWKSRNLALPHTSASEISIGEGWEYRIFSEDLSRAIVQPFGPFVACTSELGTAQPCLSKQASEQTAFVASNYTEGEASREPCHEGCYTPLVTGAEGFANVPPETVFGQTSVQGKPCPSNTICGPRFLDGTPDLSHAIIESHVALTPSSSPKGTVPIDSLYEWSATAQPSEQLRLVSVLPGNTSHEALPAQNPIFGVIEGNARNSISPDGSRVVFTAAGSGGSSHNHVYLRINATQAQSPIGASGECLVAADACTVQIDVGLPGSAQFQTANSEVTRIFFTSGEGTNTDLYEYNLEKHELERMTTGATVVGAVVGAANDGSRIYFVGNGSLAPHAVAGHCVAGSNVPEASGCNLYEMHYDGTSWEPPTLIGVLSYMDNSDFIRPGGSNFAVLTARVSPNGQWLAFVSRNRLTGYDNQDAASNEPDAEVYEYDAATGRLVCASCNPTGARPHGLNAERINTANGGIAGGHQVYAGWVAANLPPWTPSLASSVAIYQSRYLSDGGRLFFDAADGLVAKDTNGTEDVYEYEPEGVPAGEHACSAVKEDGGVTFKPAHSRQVEGLEVQEGAGCVGLVSSGESSDESGFLDASESGSEVFFITTAKLSGQDTDSSYDVYDARECTAASPCLGGSATSTRPCEEEASCKPPPSSPPEVFSPSGSAVFSGPGNLVEPLTAPAVAKAKAPTKAQLLAKALKTCRKDKARKKRVECERKARKRYGAKQAAKVSKTGHGGRKKR